MGNAVFLPMAALPEQQFLAWGWRLPFLVSIVLVLVGLFIRLRIVESPAFQRARETNTVVRVPILTVLRTYPKRVLLTAGAYLSSGVTFYVANVFGISYGTEQLGLERSTMLTLTIITAAFTVFGLAAFGALSDKIGRKPTFIGGVVGMGAFAFPWLWLLDTRVFALMLLGYLLLFIPYSACFGALPAFFAENYGTRVRYSGFSLGYTLGTIVGSAFAPIIATYLLDQTGSGAAIGVYMVFIAVVSTVSALLLAETYRSDIDEDPLAREVAAAQRVSDARQGQG